MPSSSTQLHELEDDLTLQYVLLDTLEPTIPDYVERKANIEREIADIEDRIQNLPSPLPSPSASTPTSDAQQRKRFRDDDEYTAMPYRGNKSQRTVNHSLETYLSSDELPDDLTQFFDSDMNAGRSKPWLGHSALERSKQREQESERQRQQTLQDAELARQLSQPTQADSSSQQNTFRRPANLHGPSLAQRNLNPNGTLRSMPSSSDYSHLNTKLPIGSSRPAPLQASLSQYPIQFGQPTGPQYGNIGHASVPASPSYAFSASAPDFFSGHTQSFTPAVKQEPIAGRGPLIAWRPGNNPAQQAFEFTGSTLPSPPISLTQDMPGPIPLSDDSDSSLEEISESDFLPSSRSRQQSNQPPTGYQNPANGQMLLWNPPQASTVNPVYIDDVPSAPGRRLPWQQQQNVGARGPMFSSGPVPIGSSNGLLGQANAMLRDVIGRATAVIQGVPHNVSAPTPNMRSSMPDNARQALENHSYLYADSSRSEEDIKKLLENIRPDQDLPPELRKGTPDDMSTTLLEHQKLGLSWLWENEEKMKGGILADDMGLGKTIQALALMVSRRSEDPRRKTNLIVAPVALLRQWESEIEEKIKKRSALSVFRYHGNNKKVPFQRLRDYDVVLTTFGSLTSEYKKLVEWMHLKKNDPTAKHKPLSLLGEHCQWYRVILDEAQNIKNKNALCSKAAHSIDATYRICMTGTPMMNTVEELYPLLRFCRFKPYDHWDIFNRDIYAKIKSVNQVSNDNGMKTLQTVIRATMLRRTKKSKLDGKPLITLPERTTEESEVSFMSEEQKFYHDLEQKSQATVKNMISKGTLGKKYGCALVLLLRLRQACCHQHLVFFSESASTMSRLDCPPETMLDLAKELKPEVISRVKAEDGAFDCPICLDGTENPALLLPCGHWVCLDCFTSLKDSTNINMEGSNMKCPVCRGPVNPTKGYTDYQAFKQVHQPDLFDEEEKQKNIQLGLDVEVESVDSDNSDGSDSDSDGGNASETEDETLGGFIVADDYDEDDDGVDDSSSRSRPEKVKKANSMKSFLKTKSKSRKQTNKGKGKGKSKGKEYYKTKSLAELKKEGQSNKAARKIYYKRLNKWYVPSAKIVRTIEILNQIAMEMPGEKTLIFSQFTSYLDLVEVGLNRENRWKIERYDGSMSADHRAAAVDRFRRDPSITVMLISLKAGNAGLNLNFASQVIIEDPFYNPFVMEQAIDRAHRIGQRHDVNVYYITIPGTVEDRILQLCQKKRETIEKALDETEGKAVGRLGTRELAFLFGLDLQGRTLPPGSRPPGTSGPVPSHRTIAGPSGLRQAMPVRPSNPQTSSLRNQSVQSIQSPALPTPPARQMPPVPMPQSLWRPNVPPAMQHAPTINPALLAHRPSSAFHSRSDSTDSSGSYSSENDQY